MSALNLVRCCQRLPLVAAWLVSAPYSLVYAARAAAEMPRLLLLHSSSLERNAWASAARRLVSPLLRSASVASVTRLTSAHLGMPAGGGARWRRWCGDGDGW